MGLLEITLEGNNYLPTTSQPDTIIVMIPGAEQDKNHPTQVTFYRAISLDSGRLGFAMAESLRRRRYGISELRSKTPGWGWGSAFWELILVQTLTTETEMLLSRIFCTSIWRSEVFSLGFSAG